MNSTPSHINPVHTIYLRSILILYYHQRLGFPSILFSWSFVTKNVKAFLISRMRATFPPVASSVILSLWNHLVKNINYLALHLYNCVHHLGNDNKLSPCFRTFQIGNAADKSLPKRILIYILFKYVVTIVTSFVGTRIPNSREYCTTVRFKVLTEANMKMAAFWDVAPCSLVEVDRRFRDAHCLHHQMSDSSPWWWRQYAPLKRRAILRDYTAQYSRRLSYFCCAILLSWVMRFLGVHEKLMHWPIVTFLQYLMIMDAFSLYVGTQLIVHS
jgi:hypothetical protein